MGTHYRLILFCLLISSVELVVKERCLTGYMTDVQEWVDEDGELTPAVEYQNAIDLSSHTNPVNLLRQKVTLFRFSPNRSVKYLSLARCRLSRVPPVFHIMDSNGRFLYDTVEYVTFFGNIFMDVSTVGEQYDVIFNATEARETEIGVTTSEGTISVWSSGLQQTKFPRLKELDFRSCAIKVLTSNLFAGMPQLESLYLGENNILYLHAEAFKGLSKLIHLDLSRNIANDKRGVTKHMIIESFSIFEDLKNLSSLDLSFTRLTQKNVGVLKGLGKSMQRLSLCGTDLSSLGSSIFSNTSMKILDLSYNEEILKYKSTLDGIENTLQFLYAKDVGLTSIQMFKDFTKLEVLRLSKNQIAKVPEDVIATWSNLQILDLSYNRLTTWFEPKFSLIPELKFLSVRKNNINVISEEMVEDFSNLEFLSLSGNFLVCNCYSRDFLEIAARNERKFSHSAIEIRNTIVEDPLISYHTGFKDFNKQIFNRYTVDIHEGGNVTDVGNNTIDSTFLLIDYSPTNYTCLEVSKGETVPLTDISGCLTAKVLDYDEVIRRGFNIIHVLFILPFIMLPILLIFIYRRNFRYFLITLRNSAMLSLIDKKESVNASVPDGTIFNYDVFVSYCNEDRDWVLDHLIPQMESDCNISACLHERDFQVGLSILENIVSCMDRSRAIMLIISRKFLMSQWCQFEMHLAQHRLLETRREDLILVLLEEIPRSLRPTTLHYLMLTKTYIVWPKQESDHATFWKRLKKSFTSQRLKQQTRESIA